MHLADAFIQSDLHCIQVTVSTFYQLLLSLGIEPMILALLTPCSTSWATGNTHSRHCFDKFSHLNILRAAHFWSNTTCKFFLRTVPMLFNKAFTGRNLHLDFLRKLHCVMFERRGIWIWKEHMPSFRTENNTQHYTLHMQLDSLLSSWFIYISSSLSFRGLRMDCAARLRLGLGLENLLLFSATITWAEMEAVSVSFTSWCWKTLSSRTPLEEPSSSRPSLCSPTCVSHQQSLLWLLHE